MNATAKRYLIGKRVVLPDGRRGMIVNADDGSGCVVVVTPGASCQALECELKPDQGNPADKETVPF